MTYGCGENGGQLTFSLLCDSLLSYSLPVHLHDRLHALFVLFFEIWLVGIDPFGATHDQRCVIWVEAIECVYVGHTCSETYAFFFLEVFHCFCFAEKY